MHTNVPGIDIAILVLSTNNEKTFRDRGSGFDNLSLFRTLAIHMARKVMEVKD